MIVIATVIVIVIVTVLTISQWNDCYELVQLLQFKHSNNTGRQQTNLGKHGEIIVLFLTENLSVYFFNLLDSVHLYETLLLETFEKTHPKPALQKV